MFSLSFQAAPSITTSILRRSLISRVAGAFSASRRDDSSLRPVLLLLPLRSGFIRFTRDTLRLSYLDNIAFLLGLHINMFHSLAHRALSLTYVCWPIKAFAISR